MILKGIIMSIEDDHAILLAKGGYFLNIKKKENMEVGRTIVATEDDIISKPQIHAPSHKIILPMIAAILMLFIIPVTFLSAQPYAVVSLDINPSIELGLAKDGSIKTITGKNLDANSLHLEELKGENLASAMTSLQERLITQNYLTPNDYILIGYTQLKGSDDTLEELTKATLLEIFKGKHLVYLPASKANYKQAQKSNLSLGRYEAGILSAEQIDDLDLDDMTVEELLQFLKSTNIQLLSGEALDELFDELDDLDDDAISTINGGTIPNRNITGTGTDDDDDNDSNNDDIDDDRDDSSVDDIDDIYVNHNDSSVDDIDDDHNDSSVDDIDDGYNDSNVDDIDDIDDNHNNSNDDTNNDDNDTNNDDYDDDDNDN